MTAPADNPIRRAARELSKQGFRPLPVKPGEKHPYLKWTKYRDSYNYLTIASEFSADRGLWSMMGSHVGWICLDCDNDAAIQLWRERLGDAFDKTARVRPRKGVHCYFTAPTDRGELPNWTQDNDPEALARGAKYDLQGDGRGVMLPPSRHPDDPSVVYTWEVLPEAALEAPEILLTHPDVWPGADATPSIAEKRAGTAKTGRSVLAHLLAHPPTGDGERNNWHNKVSGHFAKTMPYLDAYESLALTLNSVLGMPLDDDEVLKTWGSAWQTEQEGRQTDLGTADSAWLSGDGTHLYTVVKVPVGKDQFRLEKQEWANADVIAEGVIDSDLTGRTYIVRVQRKDGLVHRDMVQPGMLGSANDTNKWLARHGVSVLTPKYEAIKSAGHVGQRILRYLEWQRPDAYRAVQYLGWHRDVGFVTHEGVITAKGMRPHEGVMPDPWLRDLAPYHYGMEDVAIAKEVLREVLTFQDETVTAVFGAWWAACYLKGQIVDLWGHFPYLLITAASESGKTRGFFRLMNALAGSTQFGVGTRASMRDYIGGHRNGIVHIDDPDSVDNLAELLRLAAGEATISKKGQDNRSTVGTKLVAPILLSGESIGLSDEKAHRDRSIQIDVPSPIGRMSRHDPTRPQIDDIYELERQHPDLTVFAGSLVQSALQQASKVKQLATLRGPAGRHNEIKAILRFGARVLHGMLHEGPSDESDGYDADWIVNKVDQWCTAQQDLGQANTLLVRILPWAITAEQWRAAATPIGAPPAYIDKQGRIWCNVERLASEWQKELQRRGQRDRLSSEDAIRAQLRAIGASNSAPQWVVPRDVRSDDNVDRRRIRYYEIPAAYNELVLGEVPEDAVPAQARKIAGTSSQPHRSKPKASEKPIPEPRPEPDEGAPPVGYGR